MSNLATTRLSSKGQVVIPEEIRERMKLHTGDQFLVIAEGDVVILKTITPPSIKEFNSLIAQARHQAKTTKPTKNIVKNTIKEARKK